ncbi:MAG TPA: hypothetical protein PK643_02425, partial [Saprospiraceae bacterium]|nr:hypothetical protein [Saprospiraceae bacterium]
MYKIYSTAQVCCLATPQELLPNLTGTITAPVVPYLHKKIFSNYLGRTEYPQVTFFADDLEKMWETYKKQFIYLEAAGGLVFNSSRNL